jgi:hypothetical protein
MPALDFLLAQLMEFGIFDLTPFFLVSSALFIVLYSMRTRIRLGKFTSLALSLIIGSIAGYGLAGAMVSTFADRVLIRMFSSSLVVFLVVVVAILWKWK